jgi:hypothetical protein
MLSALQKKRREFCAIPLSPWRGHVRLVFSAGKYINHLAIKGFAQSKAATFESEHFIR